MIEVKTDNVKKMLDRYGQKAEKILQHEIAATTLDIETDAKRAAPVDTGYLRASGGRKIEPLEGTIFFKAFYAIFQELGTRFMAARPFLHPAFERHRKLMIQRIKQKLRSIRQ